MDSGNAMGNFHANFNTQTVGHPHSGVWGSLPNTDTPDSSSACKTKNELRGIWGSQTQHKIFWCWNFRHNKHAKQNAVGDCKAGGWNKKNRRKIEVFRHVKHTRIDSKKECLAGHASILEFLCQAKGRTNCFNMHFFYFSTCESQTCWQGCKGVSMSCFTWRIVQWKAKGWHQPSKVPRTCSRCHLLINKHVSRRHDWQCLVCKKTVLNYSTKRIATLNRVYLRYDCQTRPCWRELLGISTEQVSPFQLSWCLLPCIRFKQKDWRPWSPQCFNKGVLSTMLSSCNPQWNWEFNLPFGFSGRIFVWLFWDNEHNECAQRSMANFSMRRITRNWTHTATDLSWCFAWKSIPIPILVCTDFRVSFQVLSLQFNTARHEPSRTELIMLPHEGSFAATLPQNSTSHTMVHESETARHFLW